MINVSWNDAQAYVTWLKRKTGEPYRLLSEAEWEYAARAGTTTAFWWGNSISTAQANYDGSAFNGGPMGDDRGKTLLVDSLVPNFWDLYNMLGNVWQWTQDCYQNNYSDIPKNGAAFETWDCNHRVLRGGSWGSDPRSLRAANRGRYTPNSRFNDIGLRVALGPLRVPTEITASISGPAREAPRSKKRSGYFRGCPKNAVTVSSSPLSDRLAQSEGRCRRSFSLSGSKVPDRADEGAARAARAG